MPDCMSATHGPRVLLRTGRSRVTPPWPTLRHCSASGRAIAFQLTSLRFSWRLGGPNEAHLAGSLGSRFSCFFVPAAPGQTTSAVVEQQLAPSAAHPITCKMPFGPVMSMMRSGSTAPYSGVREYSSVQTLADGTHISHKQGPEKIYRDSQGRIRTERALCIGTVDSPDAALVEIRDPVSGFAYILDTQSQIAHRFALQVRQSTSAPRAATNTSSAELPLKTAVPHLYPLRPSMTSESLGTQTMEGVSVEGLRTTEIIPEGFEDNDRPITVTRETWTSPELKIAVLTNIATPEMAKARFALPTSISRNRPCLCFNRRLAIKSSKSRNA